MVLGAAVILLGSWDLYVISSFPGTSGDVLYKELWHACAGPLVTLPRENERVYYFPQGHMEQVQEAFECLLFTWFESFALVATSDAAF